MKSKFLSLLFLLPLFCSAQDVTRAPNNNAVSITSIAPGSGATSLGKAEDGASADGDVGVAIMAVRKATPANVSGTDGDYEQLQISAGRLWGSVVVDTALPAGANAIGKLAANSGVDIGDVDVTSIAAGNNNIGDVDVASIAAGDNNIGNVDIASAIPAGANNIGDVDIASVPVVGTQANGWSAASTGVGGTSTAIDVQYVSHVTIFGNTSGASTLTIQFSQDNSNFYDSEVTISANGNFGKTIDVGARYVRIKSSADVTATLTVAGKN